MTYGIPYSFVPGTKAKANEVNANFIDVIERIENTNSNVSNNYNDVINRINNTNSRLYGSWVHSPNQIANELTVSNSNTIYDLSNYLPNDGNKYEILVSGSFKTAASTNKTVTACLRSNIFTTNMEIGRAKAYTNTASVGGGSVIIPIGTDRMLYFMANNGSSASGTVNLTIVGYKKIV